MSAGKTLPGLIACSCLLLLFALLPALPSSAAELGPASDLRVTIYSQDVSFVRETRSLSLQAGESLIVASDVSERLRPDTASLLLPADVPLQLLEHNFDYDLVEPGKLLRRFLGSPIVVNSSGASMTVTLLSLNGDSLLVESPEGISAAPLASNFLESASAKPRTGEALRAAASRSAKGSAVLRLAISSRL